MILIKIEDLEVPKELLKNYKIEYQKIDSENSKRNVLGDFKRKVITNKLKIKTSTVDDLAEEIVAPILNKICQDTFTATIYNPKTRKNTIINCYATVPEIEIEFIGDRIYYKSLEIGLIEL